MASSEHVIGYHKLETKFLNNHVQHTTYHSDALRGERLVKVVKTWHRGRELGRGCSGTVFLERSEEGEPRAVKDIAKDKNSRIQINYKREVMAMAVLAKHDDLFVKLLGWYESDDYIHIAMEYISNGDLRQYMEVERSEGEAKVVIRQLMGGLVAMHQERFAHRDLKPENILVVSKSPIWVKIGDFGLAKLARTGTAFRTEGGTRNYVAPEVGIDTSGDTSEYTNAVDVWAIGCIAHELLTRLPPFKGFGELMSYCYCPELSRKSMLSKNISQKGIEFVESMLAYPPERRIAAEEALGSEWLRLPPLPLAAQEPERYDFGEYDPYNYEPFHPASPPPPPPTSGLPPPPPVQSPSSLQREQSTRVSGRQSMDMPRPSGGRLSIDQSRPVSVFAARDIDLGERAQWWRAPNTPPPALRNRTKELYFEIHVFSSSRRGGRTPLTKHVYVLFHDYSQTVVTARYDRDDSTNAALEQRHEPPPPIPRQNQLEDFQVKYGANIYSGARLREGIAVGDGGPYAFISELFRVVPNALRPAGRRAYGALVYANLANASVQQNDEIRAGDILTFWNSKFQGYEGVLLQKYSMEVGIPDHVAVVAHWDGRKKKVRAYEQGRESKTVKLKSFKIGDLRRGEVKVWRVVGRDWIGWSQGNTNGV